MEYTEDKKYNILFVLLLCLVAVFTIPYHQGLNGNGDSVWYLNAADDLIHGRWDIEHNYYANRVGTFLPYTIAMYLFGFGKWLTWVTTLEFLALLITVYICLKKYDKGIALVAVSFLGTSSFIQNQSSMVLGDIAETFAANAIILSYFLFYFYHKGNRKPVFWGITTALLFVIAFLIRESVIFYLPLLGFLLWKDRNEISMPIYRRYLFITLAVSAAIIEAVYIIKTGNPFYRLQSVDLGPTSCIGSYRYASLAVLLARITWQPFPFILENYTLGILFLLSLLQCTICNRASPPQEKFFRNYFILTIVFWWAGSQGIGFFCPVLLDHRVWLPLVVPMAISSSFFVMHLIRGDITTLYRKRISFAAIFLLGLIYLSLFYLHHKYLSQGVNDSWLLSSLTIWYTVLIATVFLSVQNPWKLEIFPSIRPLVFLILIFAPTYQSFQLLVQKITNNGKDSYDYEREAILYAASQKPKRLITDYYMSYAYKSYVGYRTSIPVVNCDEVDSAMNGDYILLNKNRFAQQKNGQGKPMIYGNPSSVGQTKDMIIHPEKYHFALIREDSTNLLYKFENK